MYIYIYIYMYIYIYIYIYIYEGRAEVITFGMRHNNWQPLSRRSCLRVVITFCGVVITLPGCTPRLRRNAGSGKRPVLTELRS